MRIAASALASLLLLTACGAGEKTGESSSTSETSVLSEKDQSETSRLNAYFDEAFDAQVARSPMFQTRLGIKTDYDRWDDPSDEAALFELEEQRKMVAGMKSGFDFEKLDDQGKLSWRLAEYQLDVAEKSFAYRGHNYVFSNMRGQHQGIPAFLINQHRVNSKSDADAYVNRLRGVDEFLDGHLLRFETAAEKGILPPEFVFDYVLGSAENVVKGAPFNGDSDSPIFADIKKKVAKLVDTNKISRSDADALISDAESALLEDVGPVYESLIESVSTLKANATQDDGAWKLPDGADYYSARLGQMTTTSMSAEEIHQLGLDEVARIHGEMEAIMNVVEFEGSLQDFFEYMRTAPQFYKPDTDEGRAEYLAEATALIDTMRESLPSAFSTFPEAEMIVKAVEPFREKSAGKAFYQSPAIDGSRPGTYYANLYQMSAMPTYQMEALAYHEGIPGHHMQRAIAQELQGLPKFRKYISATAYTEGWGLYTEFLPKEMGFYTDPYSDFGRLAMELWRAARLVVDTGLHDKKWTREEATQYLIANTPNPEWDCIKAIDRYIVMPGQATAYKIGMIKILELREKAKSEIGDAFTLAAFHDVVLRDGPVPLSILEEKVDAWIAEMKV